MSSVQEGSKYVPKRQIKVSSSADAMKQAKAKRVIQRPACETVDGGPGQKFIGYWPIGHLQMSRE